MAGPPSTAHMRLHADWHQLQQPTSHSARVSSQHPLRRSHVHRTTFYGGVSLRARSSVNAATTLAQAVHRWRARRAPPRRASTPTGTSCDSPRRTLCTRDVAASAQAVTRASNHLHYGGVSWRARTSVNEATTLANAVHRWQARRTRPRCASTPDGSSCNSPPSHLNARGRTISMQPRGSHTSKRQPHVRACTCIGEQSHHAC